MIKKQKLLILTTLLTLCLVTAGCAGVAFRKMVVGAEAPYSEFSKTLPAIPKGKGRLFIYMKEGGPIPLNTMGLWPLLSIDKRIYHIAGTTFFYVDLYVGKHKVSATNMTEGAFKKTYRIGENIVDFELLNQDIKYIRIDFKGSVAYPKFNKYFPVLLESNQIAEKEIDSLKFYKTHETNYKIGGSYY